MERLGDCCLLGTGLLFLLVWTAGIFSIRPRPKKFYGIWIGVPALMLVVLVCVISAISFYQSIPGVIFRHAVGFDPTPDVTIVNSLRHMPADWDDAYLEFYASDSTIDRILQTGLTSMPPSDIIQYGSTPGWWKPPAGPRIRTYGIDTAAPGFRGNIEFFRSDRLLIYDPDSGDPGKRMVYFRYRRP
jgi:hypothetical protein